MRPRLWLLVGFGALLGCAVEPPRECAVSLDGPGAFSRQLSGTITTWGGSAGFVLDVYFPAGRVPGAPVMLVSSGSFARATVDGDGGVTVPRLSDDICASSVSGRLVGPADGLVGLGQLRVDGCSDAPMTVEGPVLLCPTGSTPAPQFFASATLLPGQPITVAGNVPLDVDSVAAVTARPPRDLSIKTSGLSFTIAGTGFTPWVATTIDFSGVRDVLGRSIGVDPLTTRVLIASLADGTFTTPPPLGAMLGAEPTVDGGLLHVGDTHSYDFVLGVGPAKGSRRLRLRHRFVCDSSAYPLVQLDLVSEAGTLVSVPAVCGPKAVDAHVDLPLAERWALVVSGRRREAMPGTFPGMATPTAPYELDEVAFE